MLFVILMPPFVGPMVSMLTSILMVGSSVWMLTSSSPSFAPLCSILTYMTVVCSAYMVYYSRESSPAYLIKATAILSIFLLLSPGLFVLFVTFEMSLLPTMLIISSWGYQVERLGSVVYMMLYAITIGSPSLVGVLTISAHAVGATIYSFLSSWVSSPLVLILMISFLVKMPAFTLHVWLPKAHVEASTVASIMLASILLKLPLFGVMKLCTMLHSLWGLTWLVVITTMALGSAGLLSILQSDFKALVAWSSVNHMNLLLYYFLFDCGSYTLVLAMGMLYHALISGMMFWMVGWQFYYSGSRKFYLLALKEWGYLPTALLALLVIASCSPPPSSGFLVEMLIISTVVTASTLSTPLVMVFLMLGCMFCIHVVLYSTHKCTPESISPTSAYHSSTTTAYLTLSVLVIVML